MAERQAGGMPDVDPLAGRYQPGQAFTIVPTAALLSKEPDIRPEHAGPVLRSEPGGRAASTSTFPPVPKLGTPRFSADFAHACTHRVRPPVVAAESGRAARPRPGSSASACQWRLPLRPTPFVGSIAKPGDLGEQAADAIGTGTVLVSPLDMALAAGVVDSGSWHRPSIVTRPVWTDAHGAS